MTPKRPGPLRWLWYAFGGGLPARYRAWVLHDASCDTWMLRHFIRAFVQMSLGAVPVVLLVPGPLWIRLAAILLGWLVGLQYAMYFVDGSVERRVRRAGYPPGAAQAARDELHADERAAAAARYAARYRSGGT
ncbi:MAG TPA: DUF5313 family protein [Pseudonocardia sp.]|uniref:DUF5313 family protein n=1 Tax=Pseudonocardia sp. TaxID=60912 RepID=UPI002B979E22|nr:DUF5313 family protein [Pseudonocardia sp.]HTF46833.1 DUF5313 family protein [Pseudonocardia sp.]